MTRFKFWPSIRKSYDEQGEIFFTCRKFERLGPSAQKRIVWRIYRTGGAYAKALREYLLTDASLTEVCRRWYVSENTMRRCVRRFYEAWE